MDRRLTLRLLALLLCGALAACGGGSQTAPASHGVSLSLEVTQTSVETTVTLHADNAAQLHQFACRIAYDPAQLRYDSAERGSLVDQRALFFTTDMGNGYVPVAFTYHVGESQPSSAGSIAVLHFTQLGAGGGASLHIVVDHEYLIARDSTRKALTMVVGAQR